MVQNETIFGIHQLEGKYRESVVGNVYSGVDVESGLRQGIRETKITGTNLFIVK